MPAPHVPHEAAPWVERLARAGYAAKGVVYVALGGLAARAAAGPGSSPDGSTDALATLRDEPFGQLLLALIAVGLVGYVVWRLVQAVTDPEGKGTDAKGLVQRAGYLLSGLLYGGLAVEVARLTLGESSGGGGDGASHWTGRALEVPFGQVLVGLAGLGLLAYGLYEASKGATADLGDQLDLGGLSAERRRAAVGVGRAGLLARGAVFVLSGVFVIRAALQTDPGEARGLGGTLQALEEAPYGPWLLGVMALGLIAYGLYQFVRARYRRIRAA